ncbi:colicin E5-related ribonuclease [Papillibacter cinnamivorans]|uniref:colicin E5-related ribonuclease n=1 Tax=Papillibacter cinnamivorans TaxID=100176 RepID=UPI001A9A5CFE|nr:colicin E5-related ribonuclease [Papillibacter cinnamivorans]
MGKAAPKAASVLERILTNATERGIAGYGVGAFEGALDSKSEGGDWQDVLKAANETGLRSAVQNMLANALLDEFKWHLNSQNPVTESAGEKVKYGSDAKSLDKLNRQMNSRGWTNDSVKSTVDDAFTTQKTTNRATGNPATVYYNKDGSHVIIDDITNEVVQVSDRFDPNWRPDSSIVDPYKP